MSDFHELLDKYDGTELASLVRQKEVQPKELLETCIERIEKVDPSLNGIAEKLYDSAREATYADGPFMGIPTLVKDLFAPIKEAKTTNGSLAVGGVRLGIDDNHTSRLRGAGCVFVGTTTAPEFGTSYTTESSLFGPTRNPWNTEHSCGGSSGGSAALVAARALPFAHGNDGGGSIRVPSSCCGIFGLKPTRGLVPSGPMVGEGWAGMSIAHALTLSVRDSAGLLDVAAGSDLGAPYAAPHQEESFVSSLSKPLRPLRIAMIDSLSPWPNSKEANLAQQHAAKLCEALGHHVTTAKLPVDLMTFFDRAFDIIGPNVKSYVEMIGNMSGSPVSDEALQPSTRIIIRDKGSISAVQYVDAVTYMHGLGRIMANFMQDYDVLLTPTLTRPPVKIGELNLQDDSKSIEEFIQLSHSYSPYTAIFNGTGQPAMSVPLYWTPDNLPLGAHFVGRFSEDATLLALAAQLEQHQPWWNNRPPVNACR
ncbi:6-aminohexanoate-cyclic-dimer hydrolase [Marinomonas spartinae]|uniref:amidase n=1 Tax=Marinomonas spartinae TaxID=1792290 RepID=UPI000808A671|nr:amidase [Marinomonas spartinae]SBS28949.1 6-aminohexanoate-cyclic-dimer hydrolase [Marinomonas spartinae]